jgi:hypothetical protein
MQEELVCRRSTAKVGGDSAGQHGPAESPDRAEQVPIVAFAAGPTDADCIEPGAASGAAGLALLWQIFAAGDSQITFSVTHGWSAFGGADHG